MYRMKLVVDSVPRTFVVVSGGPKTREDPKEKLIVTTRMVMNAGAEGRIIGRNLWGIPIEKAPDYANAVSKIMTEPKYRRPYTMPA